MLSFNKSRNDKQYKSPSRKLIKFFEKSRDNWKAKYKEVKYQIKLMHNKNRYLEKRKAELNHRIKELEQELEQYRKKKT